MSMAHALVVDDNPQNVKVLTQMLSKQGVTSDEYANPAKLSDNLPALGQVDVVFLDLEMPGLDGYVMRGHLKS